LADAPDAYGSTLAEERTRPDDAWAARLLAAAASQRDYPLIAEQAGAVLGVVWAKVDAADPALVNIFQMWVAPESRGRGVAAALMREAIAWALTRQARFVQLGVTCGDSAAWRLYRRLGFLDSGAPEPLRAGTPLLSQTMRLAIT
jgi:ribosomal protein S18 acetylase RimI-like enzyme